MLNLQEVTPVEELTALVISDKMAGKAYNDTACLNLSEVELSEEDIDQFLATFAGDTTIVDAVFAANSVSTEHSMKILAGYNYPEVLCITAGESYDDEIFITNLIATVYKKNPKRAANIAQKFEKKIFKAKALALCKFSNNDPRISRILHNALHRHETTN